MSLLVRLLYAITLISLGIFVASKPSTPPVSCDKYNCDYLISTSIFQKGACGRCARCNWELNHLEKYLEGNSASDHSDVIKECMCNIPTFKGYEDTRDGDGNDEALPEFKPLGERDFESIQEDVNPDDTPQMCKQNPADPNKLCNAQPSRPEPVNKKIKPSVSCNNQQNQECDTSIKNGRLDAYPMPTFYLEDPDKETPIVRMINCVKQERACYEQLSEKIKTLCDSLSDSKLKELQNMFHAKTRSHPFYKFVMLDQTVLKKEKVDVNDPDISKCSLFTFQKKSEPRADDDTSDEVKFVEGYGLNSLDYRLRGPWFDLYLLYEADPLGLMKREPKAKRWDERKAYQEMVEYVPVDMIKSVDEAVEWVYKELIDSDSIDLDNSKKTSYCTGQSTFICVDKNKLLNNCPDPRHEIEAASST